ncbi:MAG: hypothetical protein GDA48_16345 [Hormoscilla sp. GM102CHS1]|nr:hypothetical protein [Hormoscilla sp. GM102CHS1]
MAHNIEIEMKLVGWDKKKEKDYLQQFYGQPERSLLSKKKLSDFWHYLQRNEAFGLD